MWVLLQNLSESWRGIALIAVIVAVGFAGGLTLGGYAKIPERLFLLETHQTFSDSMQRDQRAQLVAIRGLIRAQLCLTVAEKRHTDWATCLVPSYQP